MNVRVNRSIIGQQSALSSNGNDDIQLLTTVAPEGRERGSGDIAGDVEINIIQQPEQRIISPNPSSTNTTSPSSNQHRTPVRNPTIPNLRTPNQNDRARTATRNGTTRSTAPTDGRSANRARRNNVELGINNNAFLPPSTRNSGSINIERMERGYNVIAQSIQTLAMQGRIRRVDEIDDEIIKVIEKKVELEQNGAAPQLIQAYDRKLVGLHEQREPAVLYDRTMMHNIRQMNHE